MRIIVNNIKHDVNVSPNLRLINFIRDSLCLKGTKEGCGEGECGACTVILNGEAVNSCIIMVGQLKDGDEILTIEGLDNDKRMTALQESFIKTGAVHCGFCTPGMIMSAVALLNKNPKPTEDEIKDAIAGNLCRCTGYEKIIKAIQWSF